MLRLVQKIVLVIGLSWLAGCTAADSMVFGGGSVAPMAALQAGAVVATDKTLSDHLISFASGKNCSTVRKEQGLYYCEEDEPKGEAQVYCYRTLGGVSCYSRPRDGQNVIEDRAAPIIRR